MKTLLIMSLGLISMVAVADEKPLWACKLNYMTKAAIVSYDSNNADSPYVLKFNDVGLVAHFDFRGVTYTAHGKPLYNNGSLAGYEFIDKGNGPGVDFLFVSGGVKLIAISRIDDVVTRIPEKNWWFNPGDCIQPQ